MDKASAHPSAYVAPYFSLIQSSGYGKTKLLTELAVDYHVVFICLRQDGSGIPSRSPVADMLLGTVDFELFLKVTIMRAVSMSKEELRRCQTHPRAAEFWGGVMTDMSSACARNAASNSTGRSMSEEDVIALKAMVEGAMAEYNSRGLVIVFDESRSLLKEWPGDNSINYFRMLRRSLTRCINVCNFMAIFADTTLRLNNFAPPKLKFSPSLRMDNLRGRDILDPYYHLFTMGQLAANDLGPSRIDCESVTIAINLSSLVSKSRPLFAHQWNLFMSSCIDPSERWMDLRQFAIIKLIGLDAAVGKIAMPLLACRVNFIPYNDQQNDELVSSHMATLVSVSWDRTQSEVQYVAEPVLGEAACEVMSRLKGSQYADTLGVLRQRVESGQAGVLQDKGDIGEAVAMLILSRKYDLCKQDAKRLSGRPVIMAAPVPLKTFLDKLFASHLQASDASRPRASRASSSVSEVGNNDYGNANGWVSFLQFIKCTKQGGVPSRDMLKDAFERRIAYALPTGTAGADLIIPVIYFDGTDATLDFDTLALGNVGALVVQVKNLADSCNPAYAREVCQKLDMFNETFLTDVDDQKCIKLLMTVGIGGAKSCNLYRSTTGLCWYDRSSDSEFSADEHLELSRMAHLGNLEAPQQRFQGLTGMSTLELQEGNAIAHPGVFPRLQQLEVQTDRAVAAGSCSAVAHADAGCGPGGSAGGGGVGAIVGAVAHAGGDAGAGPVAGAGGGAGVGVGVGAATGDQEAIAQDDDDTSAGQAPLRTNKKRHGADEAEAPRKTRNK